MGTDKILSTPNRLKFFGHLATLAPEEDHYRIIAATLRPPADWRKPRPSKNNLAQNSRWSRPAQNFGVHIARRKAKDGKHK